MKPTRDHWSTLHDLALLYVAMAHGTDNALTENELHAITDKLIAWAPEKDKDRARVQETVMEALAVYLQGDRKAELRGSMRALHKALPEALRASVIDDLTHVAIADDVFLHEEGGFIGMLARAWDVHPGPEPGTP